MSLQPILEKIELLLSSLNCPLLSDDIELPENVPLDFETKPQLAKYFTNLQERFILIEWLLDKYEHNIINNIGIQPFKPNKMEYITIALHELGLYSEVLFYQVGSNTELGEHILFIIEFVHTAANQKYSPQYAISLLDYISHNSQGIFSQKFRLFPPDFPNLKGIQSENVEQVIEALGEWETELQKNFSKIQEIENRTENLREMNLGNSEQLVGLKIEMQILRDSLFDFNHCFQDSYRELLNKIPQRKIPLLEEKIMDLEDIHSALVKYGKEIEEMWSIIREGTNKSALCDKMETFECLKANSIAKLKSQISKLK